MKENDGSASWDAGCGEGMGASLPSRGVCRRDFLNMMLAAGLLAACNPPPQPSPASPHTPTPTSTPTPTPTRTPTPLRPRSTTGPEFIDLGQHCTNNWRSDNYVGTSYREWRGDVDYFRFHFANTAGGQIGSIGKQRHVTPGWAGTRIDSLPNPLVMSTHAQMEELVSNHYYFGIYGWTHEQDVDWSGNGWNSEFYIIFDGLPVTTYPGPIYTGSVTVDEDTFRCYKHPHPSWMTPTQTQWLAESRQRKWDASVNLTPIFQHFREQGLSNEFMMSLSWIVEVLGGGGQVSGKLTLDQIVVPDLR